MNIRTLLADALDCASLRLRNDTCGMTESEMETALHRMLYLLNSDRHFDEPSARAAIARIFYFSSDTQRTYAPFFTHAETLRAWHHAQAAIPDDYNYYDFCVTLNIVFSDHYEALRPLLADRPRLLLRTAALARTFLLDEDTRHPTDKIWWYVHS